MKEMEVTLTIPEDLYRQAKQLAQVKNRHVNEILAESIVLDDVDASDTGDEFDNDVDREEAAYIALHPKLRERHFGEYVAIYQGQLVDHDQDGAALSSRIHRKYPDKFVWMTQVTEEPIQTFYATSFSLVRNNG